MTIPVVLGGSSFDYSALRTEQSRLSKLLLNPTPRDKDDTTKTFEVEDDQTPPSKYPTFIKTFFGAEGSMPTFRLFMKDNFDAEIDLSQAGALAINSAADNVTGGYVISPVTGEINRGGTLNADGTITGGTLLGSVKFEGVTGLSLASINMRIAEVSNAIEGVTKILSVCNSNIDASINLIR